MTKAGRKMLDRLPEQVLMELSAIALTRATDVLQLEDGRPRLKETAQMGRNCGASIASVETTSSGVKIKFYDKLKALALLGDYLGLFSADSGQENTNLLEAIVASTKEGMDIRDIQELQQTADDRFDMVESG